MVHHHDSPDQGLFHTSGQPRRPTREEQRRQLVQQSIQTVRMGADPRFVKLRRRFVRQFVLLGAVFLGWYLGYIFLTAYARDFLAIQVVGAVNVALLLGVAQFASTFLLAWGYSRYAERGLDPLAEELRTEMREADAVRHGRVIQP